MGSSSQSKINMVILIALSMSLVFGEKAFGVATVGKTLEAGGKEFFPSGADQATESQWSISPLQLEGDLKEIMRDAFIKEDGQIFRSENRQIHFSMADADRFIPLEDYETEFSGEDFLLFLSVLMVSIMIGTGAGWQFHNARRKHKRWAHSSSYASFHSSDPGD